MDEAARECETARSLDPANAGLRSCALVYVLRGDFPRARQFIALDRGSAWARDVEVDILLREGKREEAFRHATEGPQPSLKLWRLFSAELRPGSQAEMDAIAAEAKKATLLIGDSEATYLAASEFAACGRGKDAVDLLRTLAARNYCAYPTLDRDPTFNTIRETPEFQQIRRDAIQCHEQSLHWRAQDAT
jgi:hypothetical protein